MSHGNSIFNITSVIGFDFSCNQDDVVLETGVSLHKFPEEMKVEKWLALILETKINEYSYLQ